MAKFYLTHSYTLILMIFNWKRVRLNYGTTHQDLPPSTTTHHQPKYIHHHPLPTTTIHRHPPPAKYIHHHKPPAKIYPPLPTTSQRMNHHPAKGRICSYITSFWHFFNSFVFFEMQYSFLWRKFCVIKFFKFSKFFKVFQIPNFYYILWYLRFSKVCQKVRTC